MDIVDVVKYHVIFTISFILFNVKANSSVSSNDSYITNFSENPCGKHTGKRMRIVGGTPTVPGEFPWIVSIRRRGSHTCSGVVVNEKWILTAAHCFCSGSTIDSRDSFDVAIARSGDRDSSSQYLKVLQLVIHYDYVCKKIQNDIAMLELNTKIISTNADPACFPRKPLDHSKLSNAVAIAAGWGATNENLSIGGFPLMLHKVQVPIVQNDECQQWYKSQNKSLILGKSQMCAGYKEGKKDSCWADSGGPLMVKNGFQMVVVGIVSTGIGCARASLPGIYTRLSEYMMWMANVMTV